MFLSIYLLVAELQKYDGYIVCGVKTSAGKNRKIPIHSFIAPFIDEVLDYLDKRNYSVIRKAFKNHMATLDMDHTMHDARNTFSTLAKESGIPLYDIKKMFGHRTGDLTEDVYTHESLEYFKTQIEKIKMPTE